MSKAPVVDDIVKNHILKVFSIYEPGAGFPQKKVLQKLNRIYELSKKAKSREELSIYIQSVDSILKALKLSAPDILETQNTVAGLSGLVQEFKKQVTDKSTQKTPEFFAKFRQDVGSWMSTYIAGVQKQVQFLKLHKPAGYELAVDKLEKIIEQASVITTSTFLLPQNAKEAMDLVHELVPAIQKLQDIADTHASELALPHSEEKGTAEQTAKSLAVFLQEKFKQLPSLNSKSQAKTFASSAISLGGTVVGADAVLSIVTGVLDVIFNSASIADDAKQEGVLNFIKSNPQDIVLFAGSISSLVTALFVCPPAVPFILQGMGLYGSAKDLAATIQELIEHSSHGSAVNEALAIHDSIIKAAQAYLGSRLDDKHPIISPKMSQSEILAAFQKQNQQDSKKLAPALVAQFICGQTNYPILAEIKKLVTQFDTDKTRNFNGKKFYNHLVSDMRTNNVVLIPLYRKLGGVTGKLAAFLSELTKIPSLTGKIDHLKRALKGEKVDPQFIETFAKNLSAGLAYAPRITPVETLTFRGKR